MKKFLLLKGESQYVIGEFDSKEEAQAFVLDIVKSNEDNSIFDYHTKEVEYEDVSTKITNYKAAKKVLGKDFSGTAMEVNASNLKSLEALATLITIAQAWNKLDNFVPDFDNLQQPKWFPCFKHQGNTKLIYDGAHSIPPFSYGIFKCKLCFKTQKRAKQFGKQFIKLWNDFLMG
jgi:hypothetical protein